jgi:hypothetical protein
MAKVKGKKLDPRFVSNQKWEIQYIASKFGISPEQVRDVKKLVGRSRRKIYKEIRDNVC